MKFKRRILLIILLFTIILTMTQAKINHGPKLSTSHVNLRIAMKFPMDQIDTNQKISMFATSQKGQLLAVVLHNRIHILKLFSLDDYRTLGHIPPNQKNLQQPITSISIGDISGLTRPPNYSINMEKNQENQEFCFLAIVYGRKRIVVYRIWIGSDRIDFVKEFGKESKDNGEILEVIAEKRGMPHIVVEREKSVEFYPITYILGQLKNKDILSTTIVQNYPKNNNKITTISKLEYNHIKKQVILVQDKIVYRYWYDQMAKVVISHEEVIDENFGNKNKNKGIKDSDGYIVDVSISKMGKQLYIIRTQPEKKSFWNTLYNKIQNLTKKQSQNTQNSLTQPQTQPQRVTLHLNNSITGLTIDKTGMYMAYIQYPFLNLGTFSSLSTPNPQLKLIKSYNLSKFCSTFNYPTSTSTSLQPSHSPYLHLQYLYEQRLLLPCISPINTSLLLLFHICQAEACTDFCGMPCGDCWLDPSIGEECDDCNTIDGDGCSSLCLLEIPVTTTMEVIYLEKYETQNVLQLKFKLTTNKTSPIPWQTLDPTLIFQLQPPQNPNTISSIEYKNLGDGYFTAVIHYTSDIHGQQMTLNVDLSQGGIQWATILTVQVEIVPSDNQGAFFYEERVYKLAGVARVLGIVVGAMGLGFFFLGIIAGKIIGIEMMAVIQLSYLSLITLQTLNPLFNMFSQVHFVNGYNNLYSNKQYLQQIIPYKARGMTFFPKFLQNYNFTMLLIFLPLLSGLIILIIDKIKLIKKNLQKYWQKFIGQYTFNGVMFCGYLVGVALALEFRYGVNLEINGIGGASLFFCVLMMLVYVGYFVLLILRPRYFGQFTSFFSSDSNSSFNPNPKFYLLLILQRLLVGICLILLLPTNFSPILALITTTILLSLILLRRPYHEFKQNLRQIINFIITITIQIIYLIYNLANIGNQNKNQVYLVIMPFIVIVLLLLCVGYSGVALIWQIVTCYRGHKQQKEIYIEGENEGLKKQEAKNQQAGTPNPNPSHPLQSSLPSAKPSPSPIQQQLDQTSRQIRIAALQDPQLLSSQSPRRIPQAPPPLGDLEYQQKYQLAAKIKKQLVENFGIINGQSESVKSSYREKIIYQREGAQEYKEM